MRSDIAYRKWAWRAGRRKIRKLPARPLTELLQILDAVAGLGLARTGKGSHRRAFIGRRDDHLSDWFFHRTKRLSGYGVFNHPRHARYGELISYVHAGSRSHIQREGVS